MSRYRSSPRSPVGSSPIVTLGAVDVAWPPLPAGTRPTVEVSCPLGRTSGSPERAEGAGD